MIKHIVLLAIQESISVDQIDAMFCALQNLQKTIPEIRTFTWGKNNSPEGLSKDYNYGFTMEFNSLADRNYYLTHPDHVRLANEIVIPMLKDSLNSAVVFDYEE